MRFKCFSEISCNSIGTICESITDSPFIVRLDDTGAYGMGLIKDLKTIIQDYYLSAEIIAVSIRHIAHVEQAALAGAHFATIPETLLPTLWKHPLTDVGIAKLLSDWGNRKLES
jgi:transaldolase